MEVQLLADYTCKNVPRSVTNVIEFFERNNFTPDTNDIIISFLYILMLETGFVEKSFSGIIEDCDFDYQRLLTHSKQLPPNWKRNNSYRMDFVLNSSSTICTLIGVTISDDLLISCNIIDLVNYSFLIDPLTYFTSSKMHINSRIFQNLDHLARNFKNAIAFPAKVAIVSASGGYCASFQNMPQEILLIIMAFLKIKDVLNVAQTSRVLCQTASDPSLWVKLLNADFKKKNISKTSEELKFLFEIKYARELTRILNKTASSSRF